MMCRNGSEAIGYTNWFLDYSLKAYVGHDCCTICLRPILDVTVEEYEAVLKDYDSF